MKVGPQSHPAGFDGGPSTFSHPQICETDETVIDSEAYFWDLYIKNHFNKIFMVVVTFSPPPKHKTKPAH